VGVEGRRPLPFGLGQHGVEQRRRIPARADGRSRVQSAERRVRLTRVPELGIEPQEVRLPEQDIYGHDVITSSRLTAGSRRAARRYTS
jgi:hypothetical protein